MEIIVGNLLFQVLATPPRVPGGPSGSKLWIRGGIYGTETPVDADALENLSRGLHQEAEKIREKSHAG